MAYDAANGYLVLFGGETLPTHEPLNDTWTFRAGVWTNITGSAGSAPSPRYGEAMTYDAADGYVILAGGQSPDYTQLTDIWEFHSGLWTELSATGLPAALQDVCGIQAAFDSTDNFTMFLAASCNSGATGGTALGYKAGTWTDPDFNKTTGPKAPVPGYSAAALVNDPQWEGLVLFGGTDLYGDAAYSETVVYTAGNWTDETGNLSGIPQGQAAPDAAYDPGYPGVLVFGGYQPGPFGSPPPATWVLDNTTWTNVSTGAHPPTEGGSGALAWDAAENASLYFSGFENYTWSWGGVSPLADLSILATPSPATAGQSVTFSSTHVGGTPPYTYSWTFGDGGTNTSPSPTHTYAAAGTDLVSLTIHDATGDSTTANFSLTVVTSGSASIVATPNPTDVGVPVVFQPTIASGAGGLTYGWTFGDGGTSTAAVAVHTFATAGNYTVNLTATAPGGGTINATTSVDVRPDLTRPAITANPLTPDLGQLVNFTATESSGTSPYTYAWAFGDGGTGGNLSAISHIFTTNGPFTTKVTVTDSAGQTITGSLNLTIVLNVSVLGNWSAGAVPLSVGFSSQVQGGTPGYSYAWRFGDGNTSSLPDPAHTFTEPGAYQVEAEVTDAAGHSAQAYWALYLAPGGGNLALSLGASPQSILTGAFTEITSTVSGGSGGYRYSWSADGGSCLPESILVDRCSGTSPGAFTVTLSVTDVHGTIATGQVTIYVSSSSTVSPPQRASGPLAFLEGEGGWLLMAAVVVLAAAGTLAIVRRRTGPGGRSRGGVANPEYRVDLTGRPQGPPSGGTPGGVSTGDEADKSMPDLV
jgi:PKD repeat protein